MVSKKYDELKQWLESVIKTGPYAHITYQEKFWLFVDKTDSCWIWTGPIGWGGYGVFRRHGKTEFAHRISYFVANREYPDNLIVCHKCDNPICVNPNHLFVGTHADNVHDMMRKGRSNQARGESSGKAKLSRHDVFDIRRRFKKDGKTAVELASEYGVNKENIYRIAYRQSWKWLGEE